MTETTVRPTDGNGHVPAWPLGELEDLEGEERVTAVAQEVENLADVLGKLIPIVSHVIDRLNDTESRIDESGMPSLRELVPDYPVDTPGLAMQTYWKGFSAAEIAAQAVKL